MKRGTLYTLCLLLATACPLSAGNGSRGENQPAESKKDAKDALRDREKENSNNREHESRKDGRRDDDRDRDNRDNGRHDGNAYGHDDRDNRDNGRHNGNEHGHHGDRNPHHNPPQVDTNQAPVLEPIGEKVVSEAQTVTFTVSASDPDGTTPVLSAAPLPAGATFASGTFTWTPLYDQSGSYPVLFIASDDSLSDSETVAITVNNVNRPPVLTETGNRTINEGQTLSFMVIASDPDGTSPEMSAEALPAGATFTDGTFSWTPLYDRSGTYSLVFIANDGSLADSETVTITVNDYNPPPVFTRAVNHAAVANEPLLFIVSAADPDGSPLALTASGLPAGAAFADNGNNTGDFSWTPTIENLGSVYTMSFFASEGSLKISAEVKIIVLEKPLSEGLAGRWEFDEGSGNAALDGSGFWHNGVMSGGAAYQTEVPPVLAGTSTNSMKFDGVNGYVKADNVGVYEEYTISAWVKVAALSTNTYGVVVNYGNRRGMIATYQGNRIYMTLSAMNNSVLTGFSTSLITVDAGWHHVAGVLKGDTMQLYIDGLVRSTRLKTGTLQKSETMQFGMENGKIYPCKGSVDDIRLYGRALNKWEITGVCNSDFKQPNGVFAGQDTTIGDVNMPIGLSLDGAGIGTAGYQWREISGSSYVSFTGKADSLSTMVRFSAVGTFVIELSATDGTQKKYDSLTVSVIFLNLSDGLVGQWAFDEGSGTKAIDNSGEGHDGVITGGAAFSANVPAALAGASTNSLEFDGVTGYVTADTVGTHAEYTMSTWVKATVPPTNTYGVVVNYGIRRGMVAIYQGNKVYMTLYAMNKKVLTGYSTALVTIDTGWHHVAGVLMGDTMRLYIDGQLRSTGLKAGVLQQGSETIQIGMEKGETYPYKGSVDDVRLYNRALCDMEVTALYIAHIADPAAQPLASVQSTTLRLVPIPTTTDLSTLIPWGASQSAGTSAFAVDTIQGRAIRSLTPDALSYSGISSADGLRTFSAIDTMFLTPINHDTGVISVSFCAKWDTALAGQFTLCLMDNYPAEGVTGTDISNFSTDPYGTPALTVKLRKATGGQSVFQYGGANGNRFDNYNAAWWLPGSVGLTDGSASLVPGEGPAYPLSSWKATERPVTDTSWARYSWVVRPDGMELYRNDTLYGTMELPAYSYTAPGYKKFDRFKALRFGWQGQCFISDIAVAVMPADSSAPNSAPRVALVHPQNDTTVTVLSGFYLRAEAGDADGTIDRVEFHVNNQLLGATSVAPYTFSWQSVPAGTSEVTVTAVDNQGAVSVGKVIKITTVDRFSADR